MFYSLHPDGNPDPHSLHSSCPTLAVRSERRARGSAQFCSIRRGLLHHAPLTCTNMHGRMAILSSRLWTDGNPLLTALDLPLICAKYPRCMQYDQEKKKSTSQPSRVHAQGEKWSATKWIHVGEFGGSSEAQRAKWGECIDAEKHCKEWEVGSGRN